MIIVFQLCFHVYDYVVKVKIMDLSSHLLLPYYAVKWTKEDSRLIPLHYSMYLKENWDYTCLSTGYSGLHIGRNLAEGLPYTSRLGQVLAGQHTLKIPHREVFILIMWQQYKHRCIYEYRQLCFVVIYDRLMHHLPWCSGVM